MEINDKHGQEEIVGFAVIIIIVSVILLFLLSFYLGRDSGSGVESFEANSFVQSVLHVTTECQDSLGYHDVQSLISECSNDQLCQGGEESCDVLNSTLKEIVDSGWQVGENRPVKGYEFLIQSNQREILNLTEGNETGNYRGAVQSYTLRGDKIDISFRAYYE